MSERTMSDEFDSLDASEKAAVERALKKCRALARQIDSKLRKAKAEHFVDKVPFAPPLRVLPMSSNRKGDSRSTPDLLPP
jgi:anti-sigma factor RsiW